MDKYIPQVLKTNKKTQITTSVIVIIVLAGLIYLYSSKKGLEQAVVNLNSNLATTTEALRLSIEENTQLSNELEVEKDRVDTLAKQVQKITGEVDTLEKISKTDPELLQKYSKIYFLNEHYEPSDLATITRKFVQSTTKTEQIHDDVWPHLKDMLEDAEDDNIDLRVISAFRSFGTQSSLKSSYKVTYGAGTANQFSAEQGYSEHQLGTAVDLTSTDLGVNYEGIDTTSAFAWLDDNAYKYGFVLSYPKGNVYYQYEPWHWRFVSRDLARYLRKEKLNFYDVDQRKIDQYLANFFE